MITNNDGSFPWDCPEFAILNDASLCYEANLRARVTEIYLIFLCNVQFSLKFKTKIGRWTGKHCIALVYNVKTRLPMGVFCIFVINIFQIGLIFQDNVLV